MGARLSILGPVGVIYVFHWGPKVMQIDPVAGDTALEAQTRVLNVSRRAFLSGAASTAGVLVLGVGSQGCTPVTGPVADGNFGVFLRITRSGEVHITLPSTELGQGVHDGLPRILAEELGADWATVQVTLAYADGRFKDVNGRQRTAASDAVRSYFDILRQMGASAREMLIGAAADDWQVPGSECRVDAGAVIHTPSGRSAGFGELAALAAEREPPADPPLTPAADFRLIGQALPRKDLPDKVAGRTVFGIDYTAPGLLFAALRMPAAVEASIARLDASSQLARPGVHAVTPVDGGVAVIADSFWEAKTAAEALDVEFDESLLQGLSSDSLSARFAAALDDDDGAELWPRFDRSVSPTRFVPPDRAKIIAAVDGSERQLEWQYEVPYLAHMTMEPMCATALVTDDQCTVWAPTQHMDNGHEAIAEVVGLHMAQVRLNTTFAGGGFGRKWELDFLRQAAQAAMAVPGRPVKLIWTREQDASHDHYRPACLARYRVGLDAEGKIAAAVGRVAGQSIFQQHGRSWLGGPDPTLISGLIPRPYDIPARVMDYVRQELPIPVGYWRSVGSSQNGFFGESMVDECAHAAGVDPISYRHDMLRKHPRGRAVLAQARQLSGWDQPREPGHGMGVALITGFGYGAYVIEVRSDGKTLSIERVSCVFDCGLQIDPGLIRAQIEGGIVFGLSAALYGKVTLEDGRVQEKNYDTQRLVTLRDTPPIEVTLLKTDEPPAGVGEAGVPGVAPALANAIFAATGQRLRRLPVLSEGFRLA